jgi:hypothetical protein
MSERTCGMRKPPLKKTNSATLKGNLTFQTKFSNEISTSSSLLPTTQKEKKCPVFILRKIRNLFTTFQ